MVTIDDEISQIHALILIGFREVHTAPVTPAATSTFSHSEATALVPSAQAENGSWESALKDLGDSDSEESITGVIFQYSHHFFACLESNERGLTKAMEISKEIFQSPSKKRKDSRDCSQSTLKFLPIHSIFNLKARMFTSLITRRFDPPLRQASPMTPSPTPSLARSPSQMTMRDSPVPSTARERVVTTILQLLIAIRSQSSPSMKKNLELVGEKSPQLFPESELIEATFHEFFDGHKFEGGYESHQNDRMDDGEDLLKTLYFGFPINEELKTLGVDDDVVWPAPKRVFQLSINMDLK